MEESPSDLASEIKRRIAEQEDLEKRFDVAHPSDDLKEDIALGEDYSIVTEFRMDRGHFYIRHLPSTEIIALSVQTGPRALRTQVEQWVNQFAK